MLGAGLFLGSDEGSRGAEAPGRGRRWPVLDSSEEPGAGGAWDLFRAFLDLHFMKGFESVSGGEPSVSPRVSLGILVRERRSRWGRGRRRYLKPLPGSSRQFHSATESPQTGVLPRLLTSGSHTTQQVGEKAEDFGDEQEDGVDVSC